MEKKALKQETTRPEDDGRRDFIKNVVVGGAALGVSAMSSRTAFAAADREEKKEAKVTTRVIDFHAHLLPEQLAAGRPRYMFDVEGLYRDQKDAGVDMTVLSNPMFSPKGDAPSVEAVKGWNTWACDVSKRSEGRVVPLAYAYPWDGREYLKEVERAIKTDGCKGIMLNSSARGEYLDSKKLYPLYELALELDVPIFEHPPYAGMGAGDMEEFRLHEMVGRPCDTTLSLARLILFGVLERYPALKIVGAHMGGGILMLPGRLDFGYELRNEAYFGPWKPDVLSKPPSHYISQLYVDTMGFHAPAVMLAVATVGIDHVVMGSDHPPVNVSLKKTVDTTQSLPLSMSDKQKILGGNAARLLKLS
jgi:aminocarboxymuconate-semialdehyde decarboxylase